MLYKRLGKTDLIVSELGFGAFGIGSNFTGDSFGETDDGCSIAAIKTALDMGCTFFDTADIYGYGHSERLLGSTLADAGVLCDTVIATKGGSVFRDGRFIQDFSSDHLKSAVDGSLRRLQRDYLDLYLLHNPPVDDIRSGSIFDVLDDLKVEGKIRHYGVSIHTIDEGLACIMNTKPAAIQIVYNIFSEVQTELVSESLFPRSRECELAVIAREPLANGFLTCRDNVNRVYQEGDWRAKLPASDRLLRGRLVDTLRHIERPGATLAQLALRFVLDEPLVTTTIVGIKTPAQATENFRAVDLAPFYSFYSKPVRGPDNAITEDS